MDFLSWQRYFDSAVPVASPGDQEGDGGVATGHSSTSQNDSGPTTSVTARRNRNGVTNNVGIKIWGANTGLGTLSAAATNEDAPVNSSAISPTISATQETAIPTGLVAKAGSTTDVVAIDAVFARAKISSIPTIRPGLDLFSANDSWPWDHSAHTERAVPEKNPAWDNAVWDHALVSMYQTPQFDNDDHEKSTTENSFTREHIDQRTQWNRHVEHMELDSLKSMDGFSRSPIFGTRP